MSLILIPQETINSAREAEKQSRPLGGRSFSLLAARKVDASAAPFPAASAPRNTFEASHSPLPILFMALAIWAVVIAAVLWVMA